MTVMYCPSCHKKVQSTFAKCPYCSMSFVKKSALEPKSYLGSSIFSKLKKFTLISLSILGGLFILLLVVTINSTPSFTPSSTSTSEEYTNQIEEVEPEPYLEKEQSEYLDTYFQRLDYWFKKLGSDEGFEIKKSTNRKGDKKVYSLEMTYNGQQIFGIPPLF